MTELKRCSRCRELKSANSEQFPPDKRTKSGLGSHCRSCARLYNSEYRAFVRGGPPRDRIKSGDRFHRLVAVTRLEKKRGKGRIFWQFRCDCGEDFEARASHVMGGSVVSCGCQRLENLLAMITTHGCSGTPEYRCWVGIIERCENPESTSYYNYGARGIKICSRWRDSFEDFLRDVGIKPSPDHSIDRIDPNGHYEPRNVRWATRREQISNRRTTVFVDWGGQRMTLADACRISGKNYRSSHKLLAGGKSPAKVFGAAP